MAPLDGLRAFAVICVVLYHLESEWAPSGLLGVTLFFVLSGFLITSLIIDEWRRTKALDLARFWVRRIRRILPAIAFLLLCLVVLCGIFSPVMLTKLRADFWPSLLFVNNWWQIVHDVSYFENLGSPSPVTHLWSLAIEEQFYIVWPLVLIAFLKFKLPRRTCARIIFALAIVSALEMAILYVPGEDPSRVYYGTDTRAFSLLIGSWLAFAFPVARVRSRTFQARSAAFYEAVGALCLALICVMVLTVSPYDTFLYRGGFFIVSVLTALAMIALMNPRGILSRVFGASPLVWLGKRSYGLYLWHYPLLLLMNPPSELGATPWWGYLIQVAVIIGATEFSYHFIEEPIRHGSIGDTLATLASRRESLIGWARSHVGYASGGAALLIATLAFWIAVPPTQVMEATSEERTTDPTSALAGSSQGSSQDAATAAMTPGERLASLTGEPWHWNVLLIGDSITETVHDSFESYFVNGHIDARISRPLSEGVEVVREWVDAGWNGDVAIISLGTNTLATRADFKATYEELLDEIPEGVPVFLVNVRAPDIPDTDDNEVIQQIVDERDGVYLIDWYAATGEHPEWLEADGTHPTVGLGGPEMLKLITNAMVSEQQAARAAQAQPSASDSQ